MPQCSTLDADWTTPPTNFRSPVFPLVLGGGVRFTGGRIARGGGGGGERFKHLSASWLKETRFGMEELEEERRERRRRRHQRIVNVCKSIAAFSFSHIGLAAMVVSYSIMGGFLFQALEAPAEQTEKLKIFEFRKKKIDEIWFLASALCDSRATPPTTPDVQGRSGGPLPLLLSLPLAAIPAVEDVMDVVEGGFNETVTRIFMDFQAVVKTAVKEKGWDGSEETDESALQWSLAGAILYAVTVITTIGYGHVAPKTTAGRLITIVYALIGIPLTFLYLSNIGNFLADCFRLFYKRICCDIICCQKCERKRKRERLKSRRRREMAAQRNVQFGYGCEPEDVAMRYWDDVESAVPASGGTWEEGEGEGRVGGKEEEEDEEDGEGCEKCCKSNNKSGFTNPVRIRIDSDGDGKKDDGRERGKDRRGEGTRVLGGEEVRGDVSGSDWYESDHSRRETSREKSFDDEDDDDDEDGSRTFDQSTSVTDSQRSLIPSAAQSGLSLHSTQSRTTTNDDDDTRSATSTIASSATDHSRVTSRSTPIRKTDILDDDFRSSSDDVIGGGRVRETAILEASTPESVRSAAAVRNTTAPARPRPRVGRTPSFRPQTIIAGLAVAKETDIVRNDSSDVIDDDNEDYNGGSACADEGHLCVDRGRARTVKSGFISANSDAVGRKFLGENTQNALRSGETGGGDTVTVAPSAASSRWATLRAAARSRQSAAERKKDTTASKTSSHDVELKPLCHDVTPTRTKLHDVETRLQCHDVTLTRTSSLDAKTTSPQHDVNEKSERTMRHVAAAVSAFKRVGLGVGGGGGGHLMIPRSTNGAFQGTGEGSRQSSPARHGDEDAAAAARAQRASAAWQRLRANRQLLLTLKAAADDERRRDTSSKNKPAMSSRETKPMTSLFRTLSARRNQPHGGAATDDRRKHDNVQRSLSTNTRQTARPHDAVATSTYGHRRRHSIGSEYDVTPALARRANKTAATDAGGISGRLRRSDDSFVLASEDADTAASVRRQNDVRVSDPRWNGHEEPDHTGNEDGDHPARSISRFGSFKNKPGATYDTTTTAAIELLQLEAAASNFLDAYPEFTPLGDASGLGGFSDDPFDYEPEETERDEKVTVPISICLIIISGYLLAGAALFAIWEGWDWVTGSYFCFITLSTIGFGDIVPGTDMSQWAAHAKLVLCALWLAFGLSLLAMCFNLMQEEVKEKCKWIGQKLGLLKDEGQR